jgi:hypothetical protein
MTRDELSQTLDVLQASKILLNSDGVMNHDTLDQCIQFIKRALAAKSKGRTQRRALSDHRTAVASQMRTNGYTYKYISEHLGVSLTTAFRAVNGSTE